MHRHALTDEQWVRVQPLLPWRAQGRKSTRGDRLFVDAVIFRARTGIPWRDLPENALGRSRGGFLTKIHAIVDAKGRPVHVALTPGERHELIAAPELLDYAGDAVIGDTGYDSNEFRAEVKARGIKAVISSKPERKRAIAKDRKLYRKRYLVELFFHSLKRFRGIATRFDKTRASYLAIVHVACMCLWLVSL